MQKDKFVIINNYGYILAKMDNLIEFIGPGENEIIIPEMIQKLAKEIGFKNIKDIPLDKEKTELAKKFIEKSFPEALRDRITFDLKGSGALFIEK